MKLFVQLSCAIAIFAHSAAAQEPLTVTEPSSVQAPSEVLEDAAVDSANVTPVVDATTAEEWLVQLKKALTQTNFDAGVVTTKANKTESFKWIHGVVGGREVESISSLIGGRVSTIRQGNTVSFIEPNKPVYSIASDSIRNFIPPVFYQNPKTLEDSYQFVMVSKNQVGGRAAQLIRIESIDNTTYNIWLWLDLETGLPLRMDYINLKGEVVERVLMTHLTVFSGPNEDVYKLAGLSLPQPAADSIASTEDTNDWKMDWVPRGFELKKSDRHHVSISREVSDYYLYSDGLFEFSIYIQRPLESYESPLLLREGATAFVMLNAGGFDVTVVGAIPVETAYKIASNIKRNSAQ